MTARRKPTKRKTRKNDNRSAWESTKSGARKTKTWAAPRVKKASKWTAGKVASGASSLSASASAYATRENPVHRSPEGRLSWRDGDRSAPWTPWGPAQTAREIIRGVRSYMTAGHGGIAVAEGVGRKTLTPAALKIGMFSNGYYWFEEDVAASVLLYEHPEWYVALSGAPVESSFRQSMAESITRWMPEYFTLLEQGVQTAPKLVRGMTLEVAKPVRFQNGVTMNQGDFVTVVEIKGKTFAVDFGGLRYRLPTRMYLDSNPHFQSSHR